MSVSTKITKVFQQIGWACFISGINTSHSGNISVRSGNKIDITRRGSMKGFLTARDIITIGIKPSRADKHASTEANIHRAIYQNTNARAVLHTHPPIATGLSFRQSDIRPIDVEGSILLPQIPVLKCLKPTASRELATKLPVLLRKYPAVLVKGHGLFCIGATLEEAFHHTTLAEHAAKIITYARK